MFAPSLPGHRNCDLEPMKPVENVKLPSLSRGRGRGLPSLLQPRAGGVNKSLLSSDESVAPLGVVTPAGVVLSEHNQLDSTRRTSGRGRLLEKLSRLREEPIHTQQVVAADVATGLPSYTGTNGPYKTVICNGALLQFDRVFEYKAHFNPGVESEDDRAKYVKKHFTMIAQTFFHHDNSAYTPRKLSLRHLHSPSLTLSFKQEILAGELNPRLLQVLLEHRVDSAVRSLAVRQSPRVDVIPTYEVAVRRCRNGTMLWVDRRFYYVKSTTVEDLMLECRRLYGENYAEAVDVYTNRSEVYYTPEGKVYKFVEVLWQQRLLKIKDERKLQAYKIVPPQDCKIANIVKCSDSPWNLMTDIRALHASKSLVDDWNFNLADFTRAKARVLSPETIIFGDGVRCTPKNAIWKAEARDNEAAMPVQLLSWVIFYLAGDKAGAAMFAQKMLELQDDTGMEVGQPLFFQIEDESKDGYGSALTDIICKELQLIVVITPESDNKPRVLIEHICCLMKPVPYRIVPSVDVVNRLKVHRVAMQICAVLGGVPWTIDLPYDNWMVCGVNLQWGRKDNARAVFSCVTGLSNDSTQWYSKASFVQNDFSTTLTTSLVDTLQKYRSTNGAFPKQIIIYQNCNNLHDTRAWYKNFRFDEVKRELKIDNLDLCVILVRRDSGTSFYEDWKGGLQNVPPGTVVDDVITNWNSQDFFLVSHYVCNSVARPTHYEVIVNSGDLGPDEVQVLTFKMCHLDYEHSRASEMPAHCLYAQKLGTLVAEDIYDTPDATLDEYLYYL